MANTLFATSNLITASGTVLKNGTGGSAPALSEVLPYAMANLRLGDRNTIWKSPVLAVGTYPIDFTFAAASTVRYVGLHGIRNLTPTVLINPFVDVYGQTGPYNGAGAWTYLVTLPIDATSRDVSYDLAGFAASYSSVRYELNIGAANSQVSVGTPWAADVVDLGIQHSAGATFSSFRNRLETPLPSGALVLTELGDDGGEFTLPFRSIKGTVRNKLAALKSVRGSFIFIEPEGGAHEVILRNGTYQESRRLLDLYDVELSLVKLA